MQIFWARMGIASPQTWGEAIQLSNFLWHQIGTFLLLSLVDDPAWLAWAFC